MKKVLALTVVLIILLISGAVVLMMPAINAMSKTAEIDIDRNLRIFTGGGNSAVYVSPDKHTIIIIDTKMGGGAKKLRAYAGSVNPDAKITVVNTHEHADHAGGNKIFSKASFITGGDESPDTADLGAMKIKPGLSYVIKLPDDEMEIRNFGNGHSFNDVTVYLKKRKLLMTGDLVFDGWHPVLIKQGGADIGKWIKNLDYMMKSYDVKTAVPGHGRVAGVEILLAQKKYFEDIKAALNDTAKLEALKLKYKEYKYIPGFSGFDKTVQFMKQERQKQD